MVAKRKGLGRGLGALISDTPNEVSQPPVQENPVESGGALEISVDQLTPCPWQPRQVFDPGALHDLITSIKQRGVLQPLLVRKVGDVYELIAGERRLRASREAGLKTVPVKVLEVEDREALELALIENLQREDLNVIEEAEGYQMLADQYEMTQEEIARRVGKGRATVANALRLLGLMPAVRDMVAAGRLSAGHAKVLLGASIADEQLLLANEVLKGGLSVRQTEAMLAKRLKPPRKPRARKSDIPAGHLRDLEDRLHQHLGTAVRIEPCTTLANGKKVKGRVELSYYSGEELDRLLQIMGLVEEW